MSHLIMLTKLFSKDESGAALVEYAVIFALLIAGTVTALNTISPQIGNVFNNIAGIVTGVATATTP